MTPIALALAFIALLFLIFIAGQPDEFKVSRSVRISAPPEKVFPHINGLRQWEAWSPWAKLDPHATNSFSGPDAGVGAAMAWSGNSKVGVGRMAITHTDPDRAIRFRLDFEKPMRATNTTEFTFLPTRDGTLVDWTMSGNVSVGRKLFGLLLNCDALVGVSFEKGLLRLKAVVESEM